MGSANIYLQNNTDSVADLMLYHTSANYGTLGLGGTGVAPGAKIGPLKVSWDAATPSDFWYASIAVSGGKQPGIYVSCVSYDPLLPYWKECMLEGEFGFGDDGNSPTFTVDWNTFSINLHSDACSADMLSIGKYSPVQNIFVLMLENHSFDNIFAFSGINGITHATTSNCNSYGGNTYCVSDNATPTGMPTDPGHEFTDIFQQLCGAGTSYTPPNYSAINMSGFAATYATSADEQTGLPSGAQIGDIMACFNTQSQVPNIDYLATNYVICDHWFSSLPGPTWPNRFYVHGASSAYLISGGQYQSLDDSPTKTEMGIWESFKGFTYQSGSIYDALNSANIPWRIYYDDSLALSGSIPQVASLKGISLADVFSVKSLSDMQNDLQSAYPYRYTFIEPNYGDITNNTYQGGSSQHPMDDVSGGENIIGNIFNWITHSPVWPNSMLIITYDEHGGFYDSVTPGSTVVPNPSDLPGTNGFIFNQLGVRVPAVIVSPLVTAGVDTTVYDHSSVLATIERLFGLPALTARDAAANDFTHLLASGAARPERPSNLNAGRPIPPKAPMTAEELTAQSQEPIPESGNLRGFLAVAQKTEIELSAGTPVERAAIVAKVQAIQTRADAETYISQVMARVKTLRVANAAAVRAELTKPSPKKR
jgi:phospholipase C